MIMNKYTHFDNSLVTLKPTSVLFNIHETLIPTYYLNVYTASIQGYSPIILIPIFILIKNLFKVGFLKLLNILEPYDINTFVVKGLYYV